MTACLHRLSAWVNNAAFPFPQGLPDGVSPGVDPLIGIGPDGTRTMVGHDPKALNSALPLTAEWVISRGGEYFFSPSIPALKTTFAKKA